MRENIAVIFGGKSVEHDISVITGMQVLKNLSPKYNIIPVYFQPSGEACTADNLGESETYLDFDRKVQKKKSVAFQPGQPYLLLDGKFKKRVKIDCAVLCNHGRGGEDGSLQGLLELCQIPYTSPQVLTSAVCMDKAVTKKLLSFHQISTPAFVEFYAQEFTSSQEKVLEKIHGALPTFPLIVKPARLGSSVGINICKNDFELIFAINNASLFDEKIIVEEFVKNAKEYCCAAIKVDGEVLTSEVTAVQKSDIFTFEDKYLKEKSENKDQIDETLIEKIKSMTKETYLALECDGVVRVDFLQGEELSVNEVNTIPGSLAFNLFNIPFRDLLDCLIFEGKKKMQAEERHIYEFSSDAFEQFVNLSGQNKYTK